MKFTKMQGCGNDYIYVNCFTETVADPSAAAIRLSDRHFGVGGDGLVLICPSNVADFCMEMYNADGSRSEMCGNAIRCVGKYVYEKGLANRTELTVETLAGVKRLTLHARDGAVETVTVDMGEPAPAPPRTLTVRGREWEVIPVSVGNPHIVTYLTGVDGLELAALGPEFERHPAFPERTNTEFVEVVSPDRLKMRVWERGSGETLACGTGACAVLCASALSGRSGRAATVQLRGGDLDIRWDIADNHIYMTGPAVTVFEGQFN